MDKKQFSIGFVIIFAALTLYLYVNHDDITEKILNNGLIGIFWYFISNVTYMLILISIILINKNAGFARNLGGSFALIYALDIISLPKISPHGMTQDPGLLASSDAVMINWLLGYGFSFNTIYTFYYLVLPVLLLLTALKILGFADFFKTLTGGSNLQGHPR